VGEPPKHGENAVDLLQRASDRVVLNVSPGGCDPERSAYFAGTPCRHAKVMLSIAARTPIALCNVERH
jgi:hypothetical protein